MTARAHVEVRIDASGYAVEAGDKVFRGPTAGSLTWSMPQGCHELLRALLWDEWLIDLAPGEHDCTTIHPDDLDDFELDGASEHPAYRADGSPWPAPRARSGEVLVGWVDIDRVDGIEVSSQAGASEFATVDELAVWLGMTFGPIEVPEAFQDWEVPDFAARGLIVIAQEPDPAIVTSEAWRMLIQATGLPSHLRHTARQFDLVLVPPARVLVTFRTEAGAQRRRVLEVAEPFYAAIPREGQQFGRCEGFAMPTPAQWALAVGAAEVWANRGGSPVGGRWLIDRPCPVLPVGLSVDMF